MSREVVCACATGSPYGEVVLTRILIGIVTACAAVVGVPGFAAADPEPAPGPPPIMSYASVNPLEYTVLDGTTYAFSVNGDIDCIISRNSARYGCSGNLPAAPGNVVTGFQTGQVGFATNDAPIMRGVDVFKPLPPDSRIAFKNVTCGYDGTTMACTNTFDQSGFVLSPAGSFVINDTNPQFDRRLGQNTHVGIG
jgi:hypothetical protein